MSENWNGYDSFDGRTPDEIIRDRVTILTSVLPGRKLSEELVAVFQDALRVFPGEAIKRAFRKAEQAMERFPTPKAMIELCAESQVRAVDEEVGKFCKNCWPDGWWKRERADMPGNYFLVRCPCQPKRAA